MKMNLFNKTWGIVPVLIVAGALSLASQSQATTLNLLSGAPDFFTSVTNVTYNATTGNFLALGDLQSYYPDDSSDGNIVASGPYSLSATITTGGQLTGGTLTLAGDVGDGYGTLLTGSLTTGADGTAFGSTAGSGTEPTLFEFLFTVTGGQDNVVNVFGGVGAASGQVIMSVYYDGFGDTPFVDWTTNFNSHQATSVADTYGVIPEPSSILLVLFGSAFCSVPFLCRRKHG